ncbi:MAG: hypothetical protein ACXVPN_04175 [Bacteroidia bacterium]
MSIKTCITCIFTLAFFVCHSQHVEVLRRSDFKHDYVIGDLVYVEDIKDTSRLKYIATLQIEDKTFNWNGMVIHWLDRFQTESKKLGANTFCIDKFVRKDSTALLSIKVFFAGLSFLKENEGKRDRNNIVCFSSFNDMGRDSFYIDKVKYNIDPQKYFTMKALAGKEYNLSVNPTIAPQKAKFKDEKKPSRYFMAPDKKGTFNTNTNPSNVVSTPPDRYKKVVIILPASPAGAVGFGVGIIFALRGNKIVELNYRDGRFMTDLYK